jgi:methionyl-tRNA formyltransferase
MISETLGDIDNLVATPQRSDEATYAPMLKRADGFIDWTLTATEIERRVRAFQPFPTSFTFWNNVRLTIWSVRVINEGTAASLPGVVLATTGEILIGCGAGTRLAIAEVQPEGKRRMTALEFLNGVSLKAGAIFQAGPAVSGKV